MRRSADDREGSDWSRRSFVSATGAGLLGVGLGPLPALVDREEWIAVVLGSIQDGGLPQAGCYTKTCERARTDPHYVASLCIAKPESGRAWLVDATPDLVPQMDLIPGDAFRRRASERRPFEGILLTHAHIGHYLGLALLGRESLAVEPTPCYCSSRMADFLASNGPWGLMVDEGRLDLRILEPCRPTRLADGLEVTALEVPHRDEYSDTLGFIFRGPRRSLLYLPDIDRWERWDTPIEDVVAGVDIAMLDATFYSAGELQGRSQADIPHPLVTDTMKRLGELVGTGRSIVLTHMNSSNPVLDPESPERRRVLDAGFGIARAGQKHTL